MILVKERHDTYSGKLLDLRNDYVFKAFFGDKRNTELLLKFLNSILDVELHVIELTDPHIEGNHPKDKKSIMDVRVRTKDGEQINIEMQMEGHRAFTERMYMYMAKMYVSQDEVAKEYTRYKRAIQIIITNFELLKEKEFHNVYKITNQKSHSIFTTHFETHVLELPKLKEENGLLTTELEKWLLFLKGDQKVKEELAMESTTMREAYEEIERLSQNPETKRLAEYRERELKDIQQREYDAREDGKEKEKKEVVIKMYGEDLPTELISKITGLTLEEISEIIKSI
ncbi:Rpn family recombination-promoting nuclease/putative transposase [Sporosarcina siberiensis]|uniref:Rpn family recombination-promoting nuclease/putative transposase n=1 Tax=Sporosarcina siberiensis TaxID=1365606 RepID=A0ABW4SC10_9BACL